MRTLSPTTPIFLFSCLKRFSKKLFHHRSLSLKGSTPTFAFSVEPLEGLQVVLHLEFGFLKLIVFPHREWFDKNQFRRLLRLDKFAQEARELKLSLVICLLMVLEGL